MEKEKSAIKLFNALNKAKIRYIVIGGTAVVLYGVQRATFDIDIAIPKENEEVVKLLKVLYEINYKNVFNADNEKQIAKINEIKPEEIIEMDRIRVKNEHTIDILTIPIGTFDFLWQYKFIVKYKETEIPIPNLVDLIHLKEQSGRKIDLEDAKKLRYMLMRKKR